MKHCHYETHDHAEMQYKKASFSKNFMLFLTSKNLAAIPYPGIRFYSLFLFLFCRHS